MERPRAKTTAAETRREILALHRALYRRQKDLIAEAVHGYSDAFKAYEARYLKGVRDYSRIVPFTRVLDEAAKAGVVYVGDYHTLRRAQQTFADLALAMKKRGNRVVLALEFVQGRFQKAVDAYLAGGLTEQRFLQRIDYQRHQVFDVWPNFKPLFDLARRYAWPVVAIDKVAAGPSSLQQRDAYAAARIAEVLAEDEGAQVLVLTGQLHVAPGHLPRAVTDAVKARGGQPPRPLVVYQNCDDLYWKLAEKGLADQVEAVEVREGELCVVNTSPIVCQQSFLDWLESDDPEDVGDTFAPEQSFRDMARMIARFLHIDLGEAIDEVRVYACGDLAFLADLKASGEFSRDELAGVKRQVLSQESYYIPRARTAYLATLSMSHAAEEAAHFVRHVCAGDAMELRRPGRDAFYARAFEEALGFFGSRIVNPRRKAPRERDLVERLSSPDPDAQTAAALVLMHQRLERGERVDFPATLFELGEGALFHAVTHQLGYMLGERLYDALVAGQVDKAEVRALFFERLPGEGDAHRAYLRLVKRLKRTRARA